MTDTLPTRQTTVNCYIPFNILEYKKHNFNSGWYYYTTTPPWYRISYLFIHS